jgi:hypothetical protein
MTTGKMITDPELLEVREYLGQELCRSGELVEGKRNPDGLSALFRILKGHAVVHQLTIFASVFDDLRMASVPVSRFLRERRVAERMQQAGSELIVLSKIREDAR